VQAGIYRGPFILKQVIGKNESLSMIDQLQQSMAMRQKLKYMQSIENLSSHNVNVTPISYGLIPMVTNAWPNSISGSLGIDQNSSFLEFGSLPQLAKTNKYQEPKMNGTQQRVLNILPQTYQHSEGWLNKDIFAIANAPRRQSSPLDISKIIPSCIYSSMHLEQPLINLCPFGRERYQNIHQTIEKQYEQIEINRDVKQQGNNSVFEGQVWHFSILFYLIFNTISFYKVSIQFSFVLKI
jgi:hypothetical protein